MRTLTSSDNVRDIEEEFLTDETRSDYDIARSHLSDFRLYRISLRPYESSRRHNRTHLRFTSTSARGSTPSKNSSPISQTDAPNTVSVFTFINLQVAIICFIA